MGLSAIIYKNISKYCTVQKSTQINHRNMYIKYSIFFASLLHTHLHRGVQESSTFNKIY